MHQGTDRRLSDADAILWTLDRDPVLRSTIVAVVVLDREVPYDEVLKRLDHLCRRSAHFRSVVRTSPLPWVRPSWHEDGRFDVATHVRHVRAAGTADLRSLLDLTENLARSALDPARPLWEAMLVDGLNGGRSALAVKVHHSVVDGVGGIQVAAGLLDADRIGTPLLGVATPAGPGTAANGTTSLGERVGAVASRATTLPRRFAGTTRDAATDPIGTARHWTRLLADARRLVEPSPTPLSPLLRGRSLDRRFEVVDLVPGALQRTADGAGVTLNDAFVAGLLLGLDHYHRRHAVRPVRLRMVMPVSTRRPSDPLESNRFTPARFAVQADLADARASLDMVPTVLEAWKHSPALGVSDTLAAGLDRLPPAVTVAVFGLMLKGVDFVATDVPGPPVTTYLAGAEVETIHAFAPPSGAALNAALVTTAGAPSIGLNVDVAAVPDPTLLTGCVSLAFRELEASVVGGHVGAGATGGRH
jgi:WS/DGAT/MGAT family acyltransferase